ncbi:hypothetical protein K4F52_010163 [Lecanicillium sp. MT-2017a]|nr:hypothetical protein K4F52_010163 [Lecanicillium sp. MT-2017a]
MSSSTMIALQVPPAAHWFRSSSFSNVEYQPHGQNQHYTHQQPHQHQHYQPHQSQQHHLTPPYQTPYHSSHSSYSSEPRQPPQHRLQPPFHHLSHYGQCHPHTPSPSPRPAMPSRLETMPHELQHMVFGRLDYQSLIHLSTLNRYFHKTIDPQRMANASDKAQFVMRAAKDFPQHRPREKGLDYTPGNFECYVCFRVRSPDHFDMLQPQYAYVNTHGHFVNDRDPVPGVDRPISLRRFCIECGVREGLHAPFDCLTTRTGRDWWVCKCLRIWSKPGCLRCPYCCGDIPLCRQKKIGL